MAMRILIVGGTGRIGRAVARDVLDHTEAQVVLAGRGGLFGRMNLDGSAGASRE